MLSLGHRHVAEQNTHTHTPTLTNRRNLLLTLVLSEPVQAAAERNSRTDLANALSAWRSLGGQTVDSRDSWNIVAVFHLPCNAASQNSRPIKLVSGGRMSRMSKVNKQKNSIASLSEASLGGSIEVPCTACYQSHLPFAGRTKEATCQADKRRGAFIWRDVFDVRHFPRTLLPRKLKGDLLGCQSPGATKSAPRFSLFVASQENTQKGPLAMAIRRVQSRENRRNGNPNTGKQLGATCKILDGHTTKRVSTWKRGLGKQKTIFSNKWK